MSKPLVIYHAGCADGFCCAWLFHLAFPDAEFHAAHHGTEPPPVSGRTAYIADFSYKREVMKELIRQAEHVTVLDHHRTAEADLSGLAYELELEGGSWTPDIRFDVTKSGGRMTWAFLSEKMRGKASEFNQHWNATGGAPPSLVLYTEDRDLWTWRLPDSRAINAALRSHDFEFTTWDRLESTLRHRKYEMIQQGNAILRCEKQLVDRHVRNAREVVILGHRVLCVNATVLESEIGQELCKDRPFSLTYFDREDGKRVYSLRSSADGLDVSEIAKRFGGGGHRNAAGFQVFTKTDEDILQDD